MRPSTWTGAALLRGIRVSIFGLLQTAKKVPGSATSNGFAYIKNTQHIQRRQYYIINIEHKTLYTKIINHL